MLWGGCHVEKEHSRVESDELSRPHRVGKAEFFPDPDKHPGSHVAARFVNQIEGVPVRIAHATGSISDQQDRLLFLVKTGQRVGRCGWQGMTTVSAGKKAPWIELIFMVDCRAPSGTIGIGVVRFASAG